MKNAIDRNNLSRPLSLLTKTIFVFVFFTSLVQAQTVNVWLTTGDQANQLAQQSNVSFAADSGTNSHTITLNDTTTYQTMDGFGAAMCDSTGYVMVNELSTAQRNQAMIDMFDPNQGIGLSMCRLPMGASDMAVSNYSYDDNGGAADPSLAHFSINHDLAYIVPLLQQALALNPKMKIMATPWSPPGWMKDSGTMKGGNFLPQYYANYAQYFVKFVQAYQALGIPIWSVSCQNEPLYNATGYPGMYFPATMELEFIRNYLGPAFEAAGLNTQILVYDHNWDNYTYPETVYGDAVANFYSLGTAWHWYGGTVDEQQNVETAYPNKPMWITEAASGTWNGTYAQNVVNDLEQLIIGGTQYWSKGAIKWPFALDTSSGPQNGGCNTCYGLITVDPSAQTYSKGVGFYTLAMASKFVQPGAYHVSSNTFGSGSVEDIAFKNPDGSDVVVVLNSASSTQSFKILLNGKSFTYSLAPSSVASFKWSTGTIINPPTATPTPNASNTWRVHAGGGAYTDSQGNFWAADENFVGGAPATNTGTITGALPASSDTALYTNERYGSGLLYNFQAPNALYQVTLKFSENYWTASGKRVFNVMINGQTVLTNFDIFAAAGGEFKAIDKVFNNIQPDSQGRIIVQLGPTSADNAKIDAIQIIPQPGAATLTPTPTTVTSSTWRIRAGGPAYTDSQGNVWAADTQFTGGTAATSTNAITGALPAAGDQALYQDQRYGNPVLYNFNVPAGSYQVTLKFAETYWTAAGKRVFNVSINGTNVLSNFDIFSAAGGQNKAIDKVFNSISPSGGVISIELGPASTDNALVSAIQIIPMPSSPTPTYTPTKTATASFTFTASNSPTRTSTATSTLTNTNTQTSTSTPTLSPTLTWTNTYTAVNTSTATNSFTASPTATWTFTPTLTNTNTPADTATNTSTAALTSTPTDTSVVNTATNTSTLVNTATNTDTVINTATNTNTPVNTSTSTLSFTPTTTNSNTAVNTATNTNTAVNTATSTSTFSFTPTWTGTPTATRTFTALPTATFTASFTPTTARTSTFTPSFTPTPTWTGTPTVTRTFTGTPTKTATPAGACAGIPQWNGNSVGYSIGAKVQYNGELYQCIQAHTSLSTWMPSVTPALWKDLGSCSGAAPAALVAQPAPVAYPNPATGNTISIGFTSPTNSNVSVQIYTVAMRLVRTVNFGQVISGNVSLQLVDKSSVQLGDGLYYFQVHANGQSWTLKVLVLR